MEELKDNYLSNLLGFSEEIEGFNMEFKDDILESIYRQSDVKKQIKKSKIFCLFIIISYLFVITYSLILNGKPIRTFYFFVSALILEVILTRIAHKYVSSHKLFLFLKYLRFFLYYLVIAILFHFQVTIPENTTNLKLTYAFMLYVSFLYNYMIEYNLVMVVGIPLFNSLFILSMKYNGLIGNISIHMDIIMMFVYYIATFLIKKEDFFNKKLVFYEAFKNKKYIEYTNNLIDSLNNMVITLNKKEVIFANDYTINFLEKGKFFKYSVLNEEDLEKENKNLFIIKPKKINENLSICIDTFFKTLILIKKGEKDLPSGTVFSDILTEYLMDINVDSNKFCKMGYFSYNSEEVTQYFDVYLRKVKFREERIEILIYDITEVKKAEKVNIESKFKQKILSKIAHEFKTPLISIITLINSLIKLNTDSFYKVNLLHVNNFSYFVLSLISDMIQYVSNCIDLRLNIK
jgi:hypothetical protein